MKCRLLRHSMFAALAATWAVIMYNLSSVADSPAKVLIFCAAETAWTCAGAYLIFRATEQKGGKNE